MSEGGGGEKKGKGIAEEADSDEALLNSSDDEDDDDSEVRSKAPTSTLDSLAAIEDSLPMKRGLSSHYTGKSKSFGDLTGIPVDDPKDLAKQEHPLNKKRRLTIANELFNETKQAGGATSANVPQPSPQANEKEEDEDDEDKKKEKKDDDDDEDDK